MQSWKGAEMKRIIYKIFYHVFDKHLRKKAIENHRKMWRWLAEHPDKGKLEYLMAHDPKAKLACHCYLCDYAEKREGKRRVAGLSCGSCPLDWRGKTCGRFDSLFDKWRKYSLASLKERGDIARQIAELPERKDR